MSNESSYTLQSLLDKQTAYLVIDMQNDFVHYNGAFSQAGFNVEKYQQLVPTIQSVLGKARNSQDLIFSIGMSHNADNDGDDAWVQRRQSKGHPYTCRTDTWGV